MFSCIRLRLALVAVGLFALCHFVAACSSSGETKTTDTTVELPDVVPDGAGDVVPDVPRPDTVPTDVNPGCPEGQEWWAEQEMCAPVVPSCEHPWELPVLYQTTGQMFDGTCTSIGPRACPKSWNADSAVPCNAGEVRLFDGSDCRQGFVLREDALACVPHFSDSCNDYEVAMLGGECRPVGLAALDGAADELPAMEHFPDTCGSELALLDGRCVQVGPRACPRLWDPDDATECDAGEILDCPAGYASSGGGLFCDPGYAYCEAGERALPGGQCQKVGAAVEGPGTQFPSLPDEATAQPGAVSYVDDDSNCTEACGSMGAPYRTIAEALAQAPEDGYVAVAAGTYSEGLTFQKPLHLIGLGAAAVKITGSVETGDTTKVLRSGVVVKGTSNVELSGVSVQGPDAGITVYDSAAVTLISVEVAGSAGVGLYVAGSQVTAEGLWVHDTVGASAGGALADGRGVQAESGSTVVLSKSLVDRARREGVFALGTGTKVELKDSEVRNTASLDSGMEGTGCRASSKAEMLLERVLLQTNTSMGVWVASAAKVTIRFSVIRDTLHDGDGFYGTGLQAAGGSSVLLEDSILQNNVGSGLTLDGLGTSLKAFRTVLSDTASGPKGGGSGVQASGGAQALFNGVLIQGNPETGIFAVNSGTQISLAGSLISATQTDSAGKQGHAIWGDDGAEVILDYTVAHGNANIGILLNGGGTMALLSNSRVAHTEAGSAANSGYGVKVIGGAAANLYGTLVDHNLTAGVWTEGLGSYIHLERSEVAYTLQNQSYDLAYGIVVLGGAVGEVMYSSIIHNIMVGAYVNGVGTSALIADTVLGWNEPDSGAGRGMGLVVVGGAKTEVERCRLVQNMHAGVFTDGDGTVVTMTGSQVSGTEPVEDGIFGFGLQADHASQILATGCLLDSNTTHGVWALGQGSNITLVDSAIVGTRTDGAGSFGCGGTVSDQGALVLRDCLVEGNTSAGLLAVQSGSFIDIEGTCVSGTEATQEGALGYGIMTTLSAGVRVHGSLLKANATAGLVASERGKVTEFSHNIVAGGAAPLAQGGGVGVMLLNSAKSAIEYCLFDGNGTAGVAAVGYTMFGEQITSRTHAKMRYCVVRNTSDSSDWIEGADIYGDGVLAADEGMLDLDSCLVTGSARAGIYLHQSGESSLSGTLVTRNVRYGLAMTKSKERTVYAGNGNVVVGNLEDPQITDTPEGMTIFIYDKYATSVPTGL